MTHQRCHRMSAQHWRTDAPALPARLLVPLRMLLRVFAEMEKRFFRPSPVLGVIGLPCPS